MENSPPKLLVWLAGPRVGNKGFVLQNLELSVLTVVFDQPWRLNVVSTLRLKCLPDMRESEETFSLSFSLRII